MRWGSGVILPRLWGRVGVAGGMEAQWRHKHPGRLRDPALVACGHALITCSHGLIAYGHALIACSHALIACSRALILCSHALLAYSPSVACSHTLIACSRALIPCSRALIACRRWVVAYLSRRSRCSTGWTSSARAPSSPRSASAPRTQPPRYRTSQGRPAGFIPLQLRIVTKLDRSYVAMRRRSRCS